MARVAEYLVSIFEDAIREGNYDIKDITKKALAKRKELRLSGSAGGEEVILRNFKTYLADKNSMSVEEYTKYIKDRINNPNLSHTPNWNRPLAGTPFEAKGIGAIKNTPVPNLTEAEKLLTAEEKAAWRDYTSKQVKKGKYYRKMRSERFDPTTNKFVYDPSVKRDFYAKKYLRKAERRALKAGAYADLTPNEKLKFQFFDKRISIMGDLIKKKPNYMLGNEEVVKALSTVVDPNTGKISSKKPTFTDLKKRRVFEIEHIDPVIKGQTKGRGSFLRNLQVLPEPIHKNFKTNAEKFLNKNFNNPKYSNEVKNILDKANELKVELRVDNVGKVGYKPKFENFLDKADDVINFYVRDLDAKKLYSNEIANLKPANVKFNWKQLGFAKPPSTEMVTQIVDETTRPAFAGSGVAKEGVLVDLINKNPQLKKLVEKRVNCAEGCLVKVANEEPGKITRALDSIKNFFVPKPEMPSIKYDDTLGAFVNPATDDVVSQAGLKAWAKDNPMPVQAGTSVKPGMLRKTGRALAHLGLPLPTAAMDTYFIGRQIEEGRDATEIAKDPFNWLGLATMEPLTKAAGVADKSGKMASVMRLGMSPGMIRGATRFLGLPGLIISGGLTAYDQYKKYQDKEGFVYDLFNKEEIDNTSV